MILTAHVQGTDLRNFVSSDGVKEAHILQPTLLKKAWSFLY